MSKREQIEQAIISAGAFTGEDTEALLSELDKIYRKANCFEDLVCLDGNSMDIGDDVKAVSQAFYRSNPELLEDE
ncbi:DUF1024 family protein [Staphylococcus caprae]|uniref:DUF1024 family protein n=1 Tax=Staphylococcus caprae TaxID=29380 RepID=UPI000CD13FF4|nr:DUF1024 family protein [Staphylococcus caprae]POA05611.1 hypothetical protein CD155_04435 [Staphylococcus caprae]SUL95994.1 phage protein [Staphylococcus caprae]